MSRFCTNSLPPSLHKAVLLHTRPLTHSHIGTSHHLGPSIHGNKPHVVVAKRTLPTSSEFSSISLIPEHLIKLNWHGDNNYNILQYVFIQKRNRERERERGRYGQTERGRGYSYWLWTFCDRAYLANVELSGTSYHGVPEVVLGTHLVRITTLPNYVKCLLSETPSTFTYYSERYVFPHTTFNIAQTDFIMCINVYNPTDKSNTISKKSKNVITASNEFPCSLSLPITS